MEYLLFRGYNICHIKIYTYMKKQFKPYPYILIINSDFHTNDGQLLYVHKDREEP